MTTERLILFLYLLRNLWLLPDLDQPGVDTISDREGRILSADSLRYFINGYVIHVPTEVRDRAYSRTPAPVPRHADSSDALDKQLAMIQHEAQSHVAEYGYSLKRPPAGRADYPVTVRNPSFISVDGSLSHVNFEIFGDTLGSVQFISIGASHEERTYYFYERGQPIYIDEHRDESARTGWEEVSHTTDRTRYYLSGKGVYAIEKTARHYDRRFKRKRNVRTRDLERLSDSVQRKARAYYAIANYILRDKRIMCMETPAMPRLENARFADFYRERLKPEIVSLPDTGKTRWYALDATVDASGKIIDFPRRVMDRRDTLTAVEEELKRVTRQTDWKAATAGCAPISKKISIQFYFKGSELTSLSTY